MSTRYIFIYVTIGIMWTISLVSADEGWTVHALSPQDQWMMCLAGDGGTILIRGELRYNGVTARPSLATDHYSYFGGNNLTLCPSAPDQNDPVHISDPSKKVFYEIDLAGGIDASETQYIYAYVHMMCPDGVERVGEKRIYLSSIDLDEDLDSDLTDTVIFVQLYFGEGDPVEVDYNGDGVVNLSDYTIYVQHSGHECGN